jgi:UDP-MurNAc hydroxylase
MKISMLGHASLVVETQDCKILMDPVLWDPFCEGLNESCPKREIFPEQLPDFDFLVISHRHLDHFDLRSLAYLPKKVDVLIPTDKLLEEYLRYLGYQRIYRLNEFDTVRVGSTKMTTTRSEFRVPEYGMVFADESGVFWNAVDSEFAAPTIQAVLDTYSQIDFLLTPWNMGMEGKYQFDRGTSFPFELYGHLFNLLDLIKPKAIAPGAQGFKYINESSWQNQVVFPVTRERFCHDLKIAFPELESNIFTLDPGDELTIDRGQCELSVRTSPYARTIVDDSDCLEFAPVKVGNPMRDSNLEQYSLESIKSTLETEICVNLPEFIRQKRNSLFQEHDRWQVIYQLEVIFPDGCQKWHIDFTQEQIQVQQGRNPLANLFSYITASSFYSLIQKKKDWDYLSCSGEYRFFQKIYSINRFGVNYPNLPIINPIELKFYSNYVAGGNLQEELKTLSVDRNLVLIDKDENPMMKLGNCFFKKRQPIDRVSKQVK